VSIVRTDLYYIAPIVNPAAVAPIVGHFRALCPEEDGEDFH
jgi:hypothetical protein